MAVSWCEICGKIKYDWQKHACPPVWFVEHEEWMGDDLARVFATDAQEAAEEWARRDDSRGDYTIVGGDEQVVTVYDSLERTNGKTFEVSGETEAVYSAQEIEQKAQK